MKGEPLGPPELPWLWVLGGAVLGCEPHRIRWLETVVSGIVVLSLRNAVSFRDSDL